MKVGCYRCGGKHHAADCPFKDSECHHCKQKGLLARVCMNKGKLQGSRHNKSDRSTYATGDTCSHREGCHHIRGVHPVQSDQRQSQAHHHYSQVNDVSQYGSGYCIERPSLSSVTLRTTTSGLKNAPHNSTLKRATADVHWRVTEGVGERFCRHTLQGATRTPATGVCRRKWPQPPR